MVKKLTYDFVKEQFEKEGYTLLSKEYKNNYTKLEYVCFKGHQHDIVWKNWQRGDRCPYCAGNVIFTYEFVKEGFEKEGYTLLSKEYVNAHSKLSYICPNGHQSSITWRSWQNNNRCSHCVGNAKLTIDVVKESFENLGYTLLDKSYINNNTKLTIICPKGHKYKTTWANWQSGYKCPHCAGNVRLTIEFVKEQFEKEGYTLLSTKYINAHTKLKYKCLNGHEHRINWSNWFLGKRCPYCVGLARLKYEDVKASFEAEGYILLSKEYINARIPLKYICPNGHSYNTTWSSWQQGQRCPYCAGNAKPTIEFIRSEFKTEGYTLLSNIYKNNKTKLDYICPNNHKHFINWSNWVIGKRCPHCAGNVKLTIDFVREQFEKEGYALLSKEYINNSTKLEYRCPYKHQHSITWGDWRNGYRCPTCWNTRRFGEGHWNWKGGKSLEPYCEVWRDQEYKQDIRERDGNACLNPYCYGNGGVLSIHHIDYNKKNCHPSNLITVCRSCNLRANHDREWHEAWYKAIMYRRYNYDYN